MTRVYPLIICGGNGTRLWPVSRTQSPKQFQKVGEADSLSFFQAAVQRHRGAGYEAPVIVSAVRHRDTIAAQLAEIDVAAEVIHEPMWRNTGPAVLAAAFTLVARDPDALMVVVPADHVIEGDLNATIMAMRAPAVGGKIITFGIKPRYAETGFGYITDGGPDFDYPGLRSVQRFVEKPPTRKARLLVESNIAYWASGISMFAARTIIDEYRKFDAATVVAVERAVAEGRRAADGPRNQAAPVSTARANHAWQRVARARAYGCCHPPRRVTRVTRWWRASVDVDDRINHSVSARSEIIAARVSQPDTQARSVLRN